MSFIVLLSVFFLCIISCTADTTLDNNVIDRTNNPLNVIFKQARSVFQKWFSFNLKDGRKNNSFFSKDVVLEAIIDGNFNRASDILLDALEKDGENADIYYLLGSVLMFQNKYESAGELLYEAVRLSNWTDIAMICNLAESLRNTKDLELAKGIIAKGLEAHKSDSAGLLSYNMATILENGQNYSSASDWFLSSALKDSSNENTWLRASTLLFPKEARNYKFAENVLLEAFNYLPNSTAILYYLGLTMQSTNRVNESMYFYTAAYELIMTNKSNVQANDASSAISSFSTLEIDVVCNLASVHHSLGTADKTIPLELYEMCVRVRPNNAVTLGNYALFLLQQLNRSYDGLEMIQKALSMSSVDQQPRLKAIEELCLSGQASDRTSNQETLQQQVRYLAARGQWSEILALLATDGAAARRASWSLLAEGLAHLFSGNYDQAYHSCERASTVSLHGSHLIEGCLGVAAHHLANYEMAVTHLEKTISMLSTDSVETKQAGLPDLGFAIGLPEASLSLLRALLYSRNSDRCLDVAVSLFSLPVIGAAKGSSTVMLLSLIRISDQATRALDLIEAEYVAAGRLVLPLGETLAREVARIQTTVPALLDPALQCLFASTNPVVVAEREQAVAAMSYLAQYAQSLPPPPSPPATYLLVAQGGRASGVVLVSQFFIPSSEEMLRDITEALKENLNNPAIETVLLLNEQVFDFSALTNANKIQQIRISTRLSFQTAFNYANQLYPGRVVALVNSDIYFDDSLIKIVDSIDLTSRVFALSKWKYNGSKESGVGNITLNPRSDSQDAWIFRPPMSSIVVEQSNFFLGVPKCDNRLAKLFVDAGYVVTNPVFAIHAIEIDSRVRDVSYAHNGSIFGSTLPVFLSVEM